MEDRRWRIAAARAGSSQSSIFYLLPYNILYRLLAQRLPRPDWLERAFVDDEGDRLARLEGNGDSPPFSRPLSFHDLPQSELRMADRHPHGEDEREFDRTR